MVIYGISPGTYQAHANIPYTSLSHVYLYGSLAAENKFDLTGCDEKLKAFLNENNNVKTDVTVILNNGKMYTGVLYWWHDEKHLQHGIVCRKNEKQSEFYANIHFKNRASVLAKIP